MTITTEFTRVVSAKQLEDNLIDENVSNNQLSLPTTTNIVSPTNLITCHIDQREQNIKNIIHENEKFKYEMLTCGDIIFRNQNKDICVIERKTISDLVASIKDGRYHNQKKMLLDKYPPSSIFYILEGSFLFKPQNILIHGITHDAIVSCIINTQLRDGIHVIQTKNLEETCDVIQHMYKRIDKNPEIYCNVTSKNDKNETSYIIQKMKVNTIQECYIAQLCQIPGLSKKLPILYVKHFHQ